MRIESRSAISSLLRRGTALVVVHICGSWIGGGILLATDRSVPESERFGEWLLLLPFGLFGLFAEIACCMNSLLLLVRGPSVIDLLLEGGPPPSLSLIDLVVTMVFPAIEVCVCVAYFWRPFYGWLVLLMILTAVHLCYVGSIGPPYIIPA
jgi:hypothetical protein